MNNRRHIYCDVEHWCAFQTMTHLWHEQVCEPRNVQTDSENSWKFSKMTTVLTRRNAPTDSCHNLTALMPRCTKTQFHLTPHYICAHRNSDNLHYAVSIGYSLVARLMADEHLIVVLHHIVLPCSQKQD